MKYFIYILLSAQALYCFAQAEKGTATNDYIRFYQKFLSSQKNSRCAMYPSCSRYASMVFNKYPFGKAMYLTCDRLIRCSHDIQYYDITYLYGYRSIIDYPSEKSPTSIIYRRYQSPHTDILIEKEGQDRNLLFINKLINKEEYNLALLEIERQLFQKRSQTILYKQKLLCYRGLKEYEKGIFEYETEIPSSIKSDAEVQMQAALLYYCTENYHEVNKIIKEDTLLLSTYSIDDKRYALLGITAVQEEQYTKATKLFKSIKNNQPKQSNIDIVTILMKQKKKKVALAKALSILPGMGYLYTNHKGSAITAFIINSLLGYATYTSIKSKNYGMAGICGFLSLSFYIGNINGAGRSAQRYNQKRKNEQIRKLETINNIFY